MHCPDDGIPDCCVCLDHGDTPAFSGTRDVYVALKIAGLHKHFFLKKLRTPRRYLQVPKERCSMSRAAEIIAKQLDEANERIAELEYEIAELQERVPWTDHSEVPPDELPVPRLEMLWEKGSFPNGHNYRCTYRLIYKHLLGHWIAVPLGSTRVSGGRDPDQYDAKLQIPFRDGAHIRSDAKHLNLPAFVRWGNRCDSLNMSEVKT
jgi:hypothetical protein